MCIIAENRQTMLFSATQSETTEALIKSAMKGDVHSINTNEDNERATVEGLKQGYIPFIHIMLYLVVRLEQRSGNLPMTKTVTLKGL